MAPDQPQSRLRARVIIRADRCKGCDWCVVHCPEGNLRLSGELNALGYHPVELVDPQRCTGCGQCALVCPDVCIEVYRARRAERSAT
jgi:2-oxoglutarate ferredoxin oxidoreductase subunit delta